MKTCNGTGRNVTLSRLDTRPPKKAGKSVDIDPLQLTLLRIHQGLFRENKRVILVIEGTDTAGKGGLIRRITRYLDPRTVRVWPIGAPTAEESAGHYLQRFWQRLPSRGEMAIFDRSWYGRVLVERVEGLCTETEWQRAYREINEFERQLVDDGVILFKLFLHLSKEEQLNRLMDRIREPTKHWKITTADLISRRFWKSYQQAYQDMINQTSSPGAPWHLLPADDKSWARHQALSSLVDFLTPHVDLASVTLLDPAVLALIEAEFGVQTPES
jgi:polyphosphate kinase 2 (PPK2 family)